MMGNDVASSDRAEMPEKSFLAGLVVIWRDQQRGIHSEFLGQPGVGDGVLRGV